MKYFTPITFKSTFTPIFDPLKRVLAIAFIFLVSAQCIFKLGIITYFQANRDYIAQVLCINKEKPMTMCYGKCFLDRNIALAGDDTSNQVPVSSKVKVETSVFIGNDFDILLKLSSIKIQHGITPQPLYNFSSGKTCFHPPCL